MARMSLAGMRRAAFMVIAVALAGGLPAAAAAGEDRQASGPLRAAQAETPVPQRDAQAEQLGLRMLNCTRTGGWVKADGTCKGRATGTYSPYLKPLRLNEGISGVVAFGWASELLKAQVCGHVLPGMPALPMRLAAAGFEAPSFGENVGCSWSSRAASDVVIWAHRAMQAEKSYDGGHWRNMKNPAYRSVGIGVATIEGRTVVVFDFYGQ
jgi:uncharacterized protein YkwD